MAYVVVQRPRYAAQRRKQLVRSHHAYTQQLGIEEVSNRQPWHVRYRPWLIAASIAAGFIGMRWLLSQRKRLVENPRGAKDPEMWMLPLDLGKPFVPPEDREGWAAPDFDVWLFHLANLGIMQQNAKDHYSALREAIGGPFDPPEPDTLAHKVLQDFVYIASNDITAFEPEIIAAKNSRRGLENLWFAIYNPRLITFFPDTRQYIYDQIRKTPKEQRWRLKWLIEIRGFDNERGQAVPSVSFDRDNEEVLKAALDLPYDEFVRTFAPSKEDLWLEVFDRVPEKQLIKNLVGRNVTDFDMKAYLRAYNFLRSLVVHLEEQDAIRGAVALQFVFGNSWKTWIERMWARGIDPHDATMWLPIEPSPGLDKFLHKHALGFSRGESGKRYPILAKPLEELSIIAKSWNALEPEQQSYPYSQVLSLATSGTYEEIIDTDLAIEAARWGISETEYKEIEERWLEGRSGLRSLLPDVDATRGDLHAFLVPKDDPRGLFLGMHTVCCQHPGGAGESCAWWGAEKPHSGFYAVEDKSGKIVAQAWAWVHGDVLVFDNIEGPAIQSYDTRQTVIEIFGDLAVKILEADSSIVEVRIGETVDRRGTPGTTRTIHWGYPEAKDKGLIPLIPPPIEFMTEVEDPYTDASEHQYIMASETGKKSTYFDSREFKHEFLEMLKHVLASDNKEQIELAAKIITGVGIDYEIDCNFIDRQPVDHITCKIDFECRLIIWTTIVDTWKTCIRVRWADADLDTTEAEFIPCDTSALIHEEASDSTLTLIEELGLELPSEYDLVTSNALPPEPAIEDQNGNYALVEDYGGDEDEIFRRYSDYDDASYAREMIYQASGIWTTIYERLDDPEEDGKHEKFDELYGWRKAE